MSAQPNDGGPAFPMMLKDLIDWPKALAAPRYAGGHEEVLRCMFKASEVIAEWSDKDYQGQVAFAYRLSGGWVVLLNDYYGSCSGCDSWEDANDEDARAMLTTLANNAHTFRSLPEAIAWIELETPKPEHYGDLTVANLLPQLREVAAREAKR